MLVAELLQGVELSAGQLAELRAIDSLYYTQLAKDANASSVALDDLVVARVRAMLQGEQRILFDRNRAARRSGELHTDARVERHI
jgi:hypothetical protein